MQTLKTVDEMQSYIAEQKAKARTIGFVPTMGALHAGHMELIKASRKISDITVCSIFVNPTQFNEQSDFEKYPVTIDKDKKILVDNDVDVLFLPSVLAVYPPGIKTTLEIDLNGMDRTMEGAFRPGHFEGVMQVVKRLLDIVQADFLLMGQKDFQQFSIINRMLDILKIDTKLYVVPIKREKSGLAMSSRNKRLSDQEQTTAAIIYKTLLYARKKIKKGDSLDNVRLYAFSRLEKAGLQPEYISIIDPITLQELSVIHTGQDAVICVAGWLGKVRLIDNMIL